MNDTKARYWWGVLYPENMTPTWKEDISDLLQLPYAYCIHDKDLDNDGDDRKVHMHLFIAFPNTTTYKHALSVFKELNATGRNCVNKIQRVINARRAYNYLIHDTDECREKHKYQYSPDERILGNNFDIGAFEQLGQEEKEAIRRYLSHKVLQLGFLDYSVFYEWVLQQEDNEYERIVVAYQGHFDKLCKGVFKRQERYNKLKKAEFEKESKKES